MNSTLDVVVRGSLRGLDDGYAVDVRSSAGIPLAVDVVESARVAIDGRWADPDQTVLACCTGACTATLRVHGVARPVAGTDHHLAVELVYRTTQSRPDRWVTIETAA